MRDAHQSAGTHSPLKVAILWTHVSGYLVSCWRALAERGDVDPLVVLFSNPGTGSGAAGQSAFDERSLLQGIPHHLLMGTGEDEAQRATRAVVDHGPDVIAVAGWAIPMYRRMLLGPGALARVPVVMGIDTPYSGSLRQRLGRIALARYFARVSQVMVAGERTARLAHALGFEARRIHIGMYGLDASAFAGVYDRRHARGAWPNTFQYVGRYAPEKGIDTLVEAYTRYRARVREPWPLRTAGKGPLASLLRGCAGVEDLGFIQPGDLPGVLEGAGVYVMASTYEPWGVSLAEAAASGLPLVASSAISSGLDVLRSHYNGLTFEPGDVERLSEHLVWMHEHREQLPAMGARSISYGAAYDARVWAARWTSALRIARADAPR
jgi:glycosyltransferase involved in cell wall biosynthesis